MPLRASSALRVRTKEPRRSREPAVKSTKARRSGFELEFRALHAPGSEWYLLRRNMAESDGKPASSPLSTEEADRLSEKFKPSWEAEPEPPTVPKAEPPTVPKVEPPKNFGKQTLLGIAAPIPEPPKAAEPPSKAPDDLDWELPTSPAPTEPVEAAPIEPPPKSNPSGVGQTYVPKDVDAPAIVLKEEVKRAEERALAQLDAEHKARSAPTVLKFKAIESPQKAAVEELDPEVFRTPKRGMGVWIGLGAGALSVALIGIMVVVKSTSSEEPLPPPEVKAAPPVQTPPEPPPPVVTTPPAPQPEAKPGEPVVEPVQEAKAAEPPKAAEPEPAPEPESKPEPKPTAAPKTAPSPKPAATSKPVAAAPKPPPAPKPASPAPKPASSPKPAPAPKPASGGIVRDAPF